MPDGPEKENALKGALFLKRIYESNSLRSMSMCAGDKMPFNVAEGFAAIANGHLLRGTRCLLRKIKVPKLPKSDTQRPLP